jgi:hypothetical protein
MVPERCNYEKGFYAAVSAMIVGLEQQKALTYILVNIETSLDLTNTDYHG